MRCSAMPHRDAPMSSYTRSPSNWQSAMLSFTTTPCAEPVLHLVWLHHAGGNGESYQSWAHLFPRNWKLVFVEYPGRGAQAHLPVQRDLRALARDIVTRLARLPDRPYALFGHSMGSLVALECARHAQALGLRTPFWLGVSGRPAPHLHSRVRPLMHTLSDPALADIVCSIGGLHAALLSDSSARANFLALLRADLEACETYRPALEPRVDAFVSAYIGNDDAMVTLDDMHAWAALTSGGFRLRSFDGGHFYLAARKRTVAEYLIADVSESFAALQTEGDKTTWRQNETGHRSNAYIRHGCANLETMD